jgi:hypothetical protein
VFRDGLVVEDVRQTPVRHPVPEATP